MLSVCCLLCFFAFSALVSNGAASRRSRCEAAVIFVCGQLVSKGKGRVWVDIGGKGFSRRCNCSGRSWLIVVMMGESCCCSCNYCLLKILVIVDLEVDAAHT